MKLTKRSLFIFMAPAVFLFFAVFVYPVVRTVLMSFFNVKTISTPVVEWTWAGLANYTKLFNTKLFLMSMQAFAKLWIYCGIATLGLALLLAVILTQGLRFQKFFRTIIYMPNVIAAVAIGYMWLLCVFNNRFGILKQLFETIGWETMAQFQWLSGENIFLAMSIAFVFSNTGYFMLMYIAAIEKISRDYYEAAAIAGANVFQQFTQITLPLIKGVFGTSFVLWTTKCMGFFALSQVFSAASTVTPMFYTYQTLFGSTDIGSDSVNAGVAAGAAVVMTVVVMIISLISRNVIKDEGYEL
ncbi:MAG: sugar ABC transporter permease [Oscillospiraceae bacterium]|nr:sugar ABC transporter permease [Oscillospiraceae bacterium]